MLRLLSAHGWSETERDARGVSALHYAAGHGHMDCAALLLAGIGVTSYLHTFVCVCVYIYIINRMHSSRYCIHAAGHGHMDCAQMLLAGIGVTYVMYVCVYVSACIYIYHQSYA